MERERGGGRLNPEPFLQLDRVIHEKGRLPIMSLLAADPSLSFRELRDTLRMTDGNLSVHLRTLQQAGYIAVTKSYEKRKPLTTCALTSAGRAAFARYIGLLAQIVDQARPELPSAAEPAGGAVGDDGKPADCGSS